MINRREGYRPDVLLSEVLSVGDVPLVLVIQLLYLVDQFIFPTLGIMVEVKYLSKRMMSMAMDLRLSGEN